MKKLCVELEFEDGRHEELQLRPKSLIAAERKFGGELPPIEGGLFAAFHQLGMPGGKGERGFDVWLESLVAHRDFVADPTPASSDDPSLDSQS